MSINSFGRILRVSTWGESHGPAIGVMVDGCPPRIPLVAEQIQFWLDRRRPGQSKYTSQRRESDQVEILSGAFEGQTTGTPIQLLIRNVDQRSRDYTDTRDSFRPGHADYTYWQKYRIRDHRGGGRSSARETASRVAAGSVAREILKSLVPDLDIIGYLVQIGPHAINRDTMDPGQIDANPFWSPDPAVVEVWSEYLLNIRKSGDSIGALVEVRASGVPAGLGAPVYAKLDSDLAAAMMSINAVKAVEIGDGLGVVTLRGSENADEILPCDTGVTFQSNHAGGILGGISSGQDLIVRFAVKPAASILVPRRTVDIDNAATDIVTRGRHDPCVGIRAVPVGEAMMACVLADHLLLNRAQIG